VTLVIEIALGILLAGFLYRNGRAIAKWSGMSLALLVTGIALYFWWSVVLGLVLGGALLSGLLMCVGPKGPIENVRDHWQQIRRRSRIVSK
jgi:hypothetical protein